jgi:hypothetical protein
MHRAKIAQPKSADGRMATEAARLEQYKVTGRKRKNKLDSHRPSHGRTLALFRGQLIRDASAAGFSASEATMVCPDASSWAL